MRNRKPGRFFKQAICRWRGILWFMTQNKGIFGGHQWDMQVLKDEEGHDYFELKCFYCGEERWG